MIEIKRIDFYAQLIDAGRKHCAHLGYTSGGALDWQNYALANAIVGNQQLSLSSRSESFVSIEITMGSIELYFTHPCLLSITGAHAKCCLNEQAVEMYKAIEVPSQSQLLISQIGQAEKANGELRVVVAVRGGIDAPIFHHSASSVHREHTGGLDLKGTPLAAGDRLALKHVHDKIKGHSTKVPTDTYTLEIFKRIEALKGACGLIKPWESDQRADDVITLLFVPSYQWSDFAATERAKLLSHDFALSPDCNRMGVRLSGPPVRSKQNKLYSQGLCNGAIQCAGDGQLMIMLNDRQTIGGYPVLGSVEPFSRSRLSNLRPGQKVRFVATDVLSVAANIRLWRESVNYLAKQVDAYLSS